MATRIAWATKHQSNGFIYQWSRWHWTNSKTMEAATLCGAAVPRYTKWLTKFPDYRIRGGECARCNELAKSQKKTNP